jgi:carbonic anhydrase
MWRCSRDARRSAATRGTSISKFTIDCRSGRPSVEALLETELRQDLDVLVGYAVRANVEVSVSHLRHGSEILERFTQEEGLMIVGAEYSLETGKVNYFDGNGRANS